MKEKVQEFLAAKKAEEERKFEEDKKKTLIELGLYEKVYSPEDKWSEEFNTYEWDVNASEAKYYKKVPLEITGEEYEEVRKYAKKENRESIKEYMTGETNVIAKILTVIAWVVFIAGFIAGIAIGTVEIERGIYYTYTDTEFSFAIAFTYWCISLISGMMFLGFAEIIKLLDAIKKK